MDAISTLLLAVFIQEPLEELLEKLGDPSIEIREQAQIDLIRLGRSAVPGLRKVAASHPDPEVQSRALMALKAITEIRWWTDVEGALRAARAEGKRLLVFSTMGPLDGFVWLGGHLMRTVTFADEEVVDFLNRNYVAVWNNHNSEREGVGIQAVYTREEMEAYPEGGGAGNLRTYIVDVAGAILSEFQGTWSPKRFLEEVKFGSELTARNAEAKHRERLESLLKEISSLWRTYPDEMKKPVKSSPVRRELAAISLLSKWHSYVPRREIRLELDRVRASTVDRGVIKWG